MAVALQVVSTESLPAPYPADTKANGYRPQLDLQRIKQSKTWMLAPPAVRPWLLLLWVESWDSVPAGSYDSDEELIAARLGIELHLWKAYREHLLRGWVMHSDGRYYHPVITEQVIAMVMKRRGGAERQARYRSNALHQQSDASVTRSNASEKDKEKEKEKDQETERLHAVKRAPAPYQQIVDLYHQELPMLPRVVALSTARKAAIRARWENGLPTLDSWRQFFGVVKASRFLTGQAEPAPGRKRFQATLDWLIKESNALKVIEGRYDD